MISTWRYKDIDETEFMRIVNQLCQQFSNSYSFGIYDNDDIAQEIYIMCLEPDKHGLTVLDKWDRTRSLFKFLSTHIQNRLINLKRNKFFRATCPCKKCDGKRSGETNHKDKQFCKKFLNWKRCNTVKCSLAAPESINLNNYDASYVIEPHENLTYKELVEFIDEHLPLEMRNIYLRMKNKNKVTELEREQVSDFLFMLLVDSPYRDELEKICQL